ncbi:MULTISPECIES: hypothetical protein [Streptomyces]|uniref:hypothetical protein n=1 Tax=Streptomyces TaxID=1883 RepID=UPI00163BD4C4|nr:MULTISPECIES: hypothetical protein [Streptomyces]MBC2877499.1 hypothetical protein [Streptomyces sp. TYQ1024]UBI36256.1 hypothetical protein K7I03_07145 [Streptomyces mobaraensis]UKW28850.1 hypothetical protein MCU78_07130 [Streptomyces sp. TYQ1024]
MTTGPLVVPVRVEARTLTFRTEKGFVRWRPDFRGAINSQRPVEPDPFSGFSLDQGRDRGIRLHWRLPEALCRGGTEAAGPPAFPLVPNRWLVLRQATDATGKQVLATSWMVESDQVRDSLDDPDAHAARYARPGADGKLKACWIGELKNAEDGWTEPRPNTAQFLTAVGPGLPAFAAFQPYCHNVFSLLDKCVGMDEEWFAVSYLVAGWYSRAADDILTTTPDPSRLGWRLPTGMTAYPKRSLFVGAAVSVIWDPKGKKDVKESMPDKDKAKDAVRVAVGNSASDALSALTGPGTENDALLTALQHGLTDDLDAPQAARHALHRDWFHRAPARFRWTSEPLVPAQAGGDDDLPSVDALNSAEAALAHAEAQLHGSQARLYHLWWLRNLPDAKRPSGTTEKLNAQLDPGTATSLAAKVRAVQQEVAGLRRGLDGVASPFGTRLARHPHGAVHTPTDPVVLIRGARGGRHPAVPSAPQCRSSDKLVTAFTDKSGTKVQPKLPGGAWKKLPAPGSGSGSPTAAALAGELCLLHQAALSQSSAPGTYPTLLEELYAKPAKVTGALPELTDRWTAEPWSPLFVLWKTEIHPLAFPGGADSTAGAAAGQWTLTADGRLRWTRTKAATTTGPSFSGRSLLTAQIPHVLQRQLEHYSLGLADDDAAERLRAQAEEMGSLDLLSQTLHGLNAWMRLSSEGTHATPAGMAIGQFPGTGALVAGGPRSIPFENELKDTGRAFRPLSCGQFLITRLSVVDTFGRSLDLITKNYAGDQLARSPHIVPGTAVRDHATDKWLQLAPRLQQSARLRFDFLSAGDDRRVIDPGLEDTADPSPVVGWLLANRLGGSLLVYGPAGDPVGELCTAVKKTGDSQVVWRPLPHAVELNTTTMRHLAAFVTGLRGKGRQALSALVTSIDRVSATTSPGPGATERTLSLLLGRPVVLLRARLRGELAGPVAVSPQWKALGVTPDDAYTKKPVTVRLGAAALPADGLYGYVRGDDYQRVYVTDPQPADSGGYLGAGTQDQGVTVTFTPAPDPSKTADHSLDTRVTLLADPFSAVHAFTDVVPVETLRLPARYSDPFVRAGRASFRTGPLLAELEAEGKIRMPRPAAWQGEWTFVERRDERIWHDYPISTAGTEAQLSDAAPDAGRPPARDGFLHLRTPLTG